LIVTPHTGHVEPLSIESARIIAKDPKNYYYQQALERLKNEKAADPEPVKKEVGQGVFRVGKDS